MTTLVDLYNAPSCIVTYVKLGKSIINNSTDQELLVRLNCSTENNEARPIVHTVKF